MTDRLISNVLGKYLSVFIKNWSKDALSLSFLKGTGSLTNLQINEQVIQEVLPIDFLQVINATVNQLEIRMPSLTRLTNDPLTIVLDRLIVNVEEPLKPFQKTTPLKDFLEKNRKTEKKETNGGTKTYGFIDRIIDGVKIIVNWIEINVKTLGPYPSTIVGDFTPHTLQVLVKGFSLQTTDYRFRTVTDLKHAIPKVNTATSSFVWVHKLGLIDSISISLIPQTQGSIQPIIGNNKQPNKTFNQQQQKGVIPILSNINCQIFITMKKKAITVGGTSSMLGINVEIVIPKINIVLKQQDIQSLIRVLVAVNLASKREDLKQNNLTAYVKKQKRTNSSKSSDIESTKSTKSSMSTQSSRSKAISMFFVDNSKNKNNEEELSDDEEKLEEELANFDDSEMEIVDDYVPKSDNTSNGTGMRTVVNIHLNELFVTLLYSRDENNHPKVISGKDNRRILGFFFEMLGFELSLIIPEDAPESKHIQLGIPWIQFKEITSNLKLKRNDNDTAANFLDIELLTNQNTTDDELKDDNYIIQPQLENDENNYTVNFAVWPEFLSTHRYYPDYTKTERVYFPQSLLKKKFFEEGKEMIRFKFSKGAGMEFVLESRINPIKLVVDVRRIIRLVEYALECLPDLSKKPPSETIIQLGTVPASTLTTVTKPPSISNNIPSSKQSSSRSSLDSEDSNEEDEEKSFSFLVEIRSPQILIPANYSTDTDLVVDVSEMLCIESKEWIITSDPRIRKQAEWGKKDSDSLFSPKSKDTFPSKSNDFTSLHSSLWEVLPQKFKVQVSEFLIQIMPSIHSPPQRIMEPLSLTLDLGINDEYASSFHQKLPKIVLLTFIESINFHMNQSQAILLIEYFKTFGDDPPMIKKLLLQSTKSFTEHGKLLSKKNSSQKQLDEPIIQQPTKEKVRLIPLMILSKIARMELSITQSSASSIEAFFANQSLDTKLLSFILNEAEVLVETNNISKTSNFVVVKSRVENLEVTSPQDAQYPSSVLIGHKYSSKLGQSPYIFPTDLQRDISTKEKKYMLTMRYEYPIDFGNPNDTHSPTTNIDVEPHVNLNYLRNPRLLLKAHGLHVGLNTDTAYHVLHFLNSRENAFDVSPFEIMNRTVKNTYKKIREKYLPQKKKKNEDEEELSEPIIMKGLSTTNDVEQSTVNTNNNGKQMVSIALDANNELETNDEEHDEEPLEIITSQSTEETQKEDKQENNVIGLKSNQDVKHEIIEETPKEKSHTPASETTYLDVTHKTFYPMIFDISMEEIEVYVIGKGFRPNGCGFEIKQLGAVHVPMKSLMEGQSSIEFNDQFTIESLQSLSVEPIQSFSNRSHEFEIKLFGKSCKIQVLLRTDVPLSSLENDETSLAMIEGNHENNIEKILEVIPITSAPVDFQLGLMSDYTKPLSKRGIWFQAMDPTLNHSNQSLRIEIKPEMLYVISKLLRSQFRDLKQWADLLQGYFALFSGPNSLALMHKFQSLGDMISEAQRAFSKVMVEHYSLCKNVDTMERDLTEKTEALQLAIQSKLQLTQMLAEMQSQTVKNAPVPKQPVQQQQQQPKPVESNMKRIIIEGPCKVLTHTSNDWKRVHCVLLDTEEIVCLTQKLGPQYFTKDGSGIEKYLYYQFGLKDTTESLKTMAPVDDLTNPKEVFALINGIEKRLFIYPETPNQLNQWMKLVMRTIDQLKIKNMKIDIEIQTDITSSYFKEKEEELKEKELSVDLLDDSNQQQMSKDSFETKELQNIQVQFENIKKSLRMAAECEFSLRIEFTQLYEFVETFKKEQEKREEKIQQFLQEENETQQLLKQQKQVAHKLQEACNVRDHRIKELEAKLKDEQVKSKLRQEENNALHRSLREHNMKLQQENQALVIDKTKIEKEYQILVKRQQQQTTRALKMEQKKEASTVVRGEISDQQLVNQELKTIISDLYVQLSDLREENRQLQVYNEDLVDQLKKQKEELDTLSQQQKTNDGSESTEQKQEEEEVKKQISPTLKPLPVAPTKTLPPLPLLTTNSSSSTSSVNNFGTTTIPPNHQPTEPVRGKFGSTLGLAALRERSVSLRDKIKTKINEAVGSNTNTPGQNNNTTNNNNIRK
ncbi:hypothetical protein ABK040_003343 [Willaertia magna]